MSEGFIIFLILQAIATLTGLVSIYVKFDRRLGSIEAGVGFINEHRGELRGDLDKLEDQVQGISRHVERHETLLKQDAG